MTPDDIRGVVALQRACFPAPFPESLLWREDHLLGHLEVFAEGQMVAEVAGSIVASASSARISDDAWNAHADWDTTLGGFRFDRHDPHGPTLYGADISVHPEHRNRGLARRLYAARFDLVRRLRLARFGTACRMPGFRASGMPSPAAYAQAVATGRVTDLTLTPLLRVGLRFLGTIDGYMDDEESGNAAALLEWAP